MHSRMPGPGSKVREFGSWRCVFDKPGLGLNTWLVIGEMGLDKGYGRVLNCIRLLSERT